MILFDVQAVQSRAHGERGIARFCLELALAIEARDPGRIDHFTVNPHLPVPASLEPLMRTGRVVRSDDLDSSAAVDLLHVGSPLELGWSIDELFFGRPRKLVVNLFDLIPGIFSEHYLSDPSTASRYWARLGFYTAADAVLADSRSAADDAIDMLGVPSDRLRVIGAGTSPRFSPHPEGVSAALTAARAACPGLRGDFVLLPSGIDWRKNIEGVMVAYSRLSRRVRAAHQLVLTCRITDVERSRLVALAGDLGFAESFLVTGFVSDELLVELNRAAFLVVFPSRYEGFGLPVLEARRCGAPVICGDNSSLREVAPLAESRFDSDSTDSIHQLLERALTDRRFRARLLDAEIPPFTWDEAARLTLCAYDDVLAERDRATLLGDPRPSIAYVTPLPPVRSGIADYSYRFVRELNELAHVRCFIDQDVDTVEVPPGVALSHVSELPMRHRVGEFDHVVVAMGNNAIHRSALEVLQQLDGAVVHLHDVRLVNCYAVDRWPEIVERHYPGRFADDVLSKMVSPSADAVREQRVYMLGDIARSASRIAVHSRHAAALVELDIGVHADVLGPLGFPPVSSTIASQAPSRVASFGVVDPTKQSDKVARSAQRLIEMVPGAVFAFVGLGSDLLDLDPRIVRAGELSREEYELMLATTDVAVQLRDTSNGESSAAVADCLAAGVPTIVTDIGSNSELPDDVVVKVPRDISDDELALLIASLLGDHDRRSTLSACGKAYAAQHSHAVAARQLLDLLTSLPVRTFAASGASLR